MRILYKSLLTLLLPVAMIWMVAFFANALSERHIRAMAEASSVTRATMVMDEVDRLIDTELSLWQALCNSQLFVDMLHRSNEAHAQRGAIEHDVEQQDLLWRQGTPADRQAMQRDALNNELAEELRDLKRLLFSAQNRQLYEEVFVTNEHGAIIAATNVTSDLLQDDELWWQTAMQRGTYVSNYRFDESAGVFALDFCLRIDDEATGQPLGVLKAVFDTADLSELLNTRAIDHATSAPQMQMLLTAEGEIIHMTGATGVAPDYSADQLAALPLSDANPTCTIERRDEQSGRTLLTTFCRSTGYGRYDGHGWIHAIEYDTDSLYAPAKQMTNAILAAASMATILALLAGGLFTSSLQGRIRRLIEATRRIADGDLEQPVRISGSDELAELSGAFDSMREKLRDASEAMHLRLSAIEAAQDIIIITNNNGIIEYVNSAFTEMTGYDAESLIGTNAQDLFAQSNLVEILPTLMECGTWRGEILSRRADGSAYPEEATISALTDEHGNINHYVTIKRDITDRKRAEQSRTEREHLRSAIKAMEQVLGVVGHELRTPLASLRAISELLLSPDATSGEQNDQFLTSMHDEVVRMSEMVNNMLEAARLSSGAARWKWVPVNLSTAANDARMVVQHMLNGGNVTLQTDVEPADLTMLGDPDAIRRLLTNLISNAAKHTREGVISVRINERQSTGGRKIRFEVADTGDGIPGHIADRLGEAFALNRGVVGLDYVQGTGLGLSICKGIVAAHDGTISFESTPGEGTTFTVTMPAEGAGPVEQTDGFSITREIAA